MLRHIKSKQHEKETNAPKKTLITDNDDDTTPNDTIWLILTTKKHIVDKNRLKPGKIHIPHSLNASPSLSVCLITADPQRHAKDAVAGFPQELASRIDRVIGYSKLKARYHSFESRRQLLAEHDVFLADDRIIMRLVKTLGKIFYQSSKRPIPIRIAAIERENGKRVKNKKPQEKKEKEASVASPSIVAKEIERTLHCAPVQLAPAATAAIRVGLSHFSPEQLAENIEAVVTGLTEKFVAKGWRNIRAIHIKGSGTMALPIWLASELWEDEGDVVDDNNAKEEQQDSLGRKRKSDDDGGDEEKKLENKRSKKTKRNDDDDDVDAAARKEKRWKQKARALEDGIES